LTDFLDESEPGVVAPSSDFVDPNGSSHDEFDFDAVGVDLNGGAALSGNRGDHSRADLTDSPVDSANPVAAVTPIVATHQKGLLYLTAGIAAATILLDQLSKIWAIRALGDGHRIEVLGEFLSFRYLRNPGAALGLGYGYTWLLTIVVIGVVIGIIRVMRRLGSRGWAWALGLLLGGAIGNLIDRLFRQPGFAQGHVVDFIAYWNWFVGNVADIAIVVAAGLIIILSLRGVGVDGTLDRD